jgi:hypothetical protein
LQPFSGAVRLVGSGIGLDTTRRPDYTVTTPEHQLVIEIKEFRATREDFHLHPGSGQFLPDTRAEHCLIYGAHSRSAFRLHCKLAHLPDVPDGAILAHHKDFQPAILVFPD